MIQDLAVQAEGDAADATGRPRHMATEPEEVGQTPSEAKRRESSGFLRWSRRETMVRAIAETLWQRHPLAFLAICAAAKDKGTTLLARIRERLDELEAMR